MKFEFLADASDTPPKRPSNPSVGYPSNGDPVTGKPPTTPGAWFYYMLMVEFTTLIEQNGLEPSAENLHQLADVFADFKARASAAEGFATQAKASADAAAVSASSATTTISEGKQAITDLQATAVAAIQTQKNEAVAAVTATQSTATESVTAAQVSSVSAVKAQEAASIQAIEADSVLAGYAKKDELSSLIAAAVAEAKLAAYPVGSIYCSIDSTDPGTLFGGTWVAIGAGRALVAAGGGFAVGSEGGSDTHTLTVEEMPSHAHTAWTGEAGWHGHAARTDTANLTGSFNPGGLGITASGVCSLGAGKQPSNSGYATDSSIVNINASHMHNVGVDGAGNHTHTVGVGATGGGQAFSVRNPYIAVNMWRRTA